jgi:hypothetical protein
MVKLNYSHQEVYKNLGPKKNWFQPTQMDFNFIWKNGPNFPDFEGKKIWNCQISTMGFIMVANL